MPTDIHTIAAIIGIVTTVIGVGVGWGVVQSRLRNIEARLTVIEQDLELFQETYVSYKYLDAVVPPLRNALEEIQRDIKKILGLVNGNG